MAVAGILMGDFTALFTGLDVRYMTEAEWNRELGKAGRNLQSRVARSFAGERVAGSSQLKANDPAYTARKVRQGYDRRRGHRTNNLQRVLNTARLFMVRTQRQDANTMAARITMEEGMLRNLVPYAEYYEEKKVSRAGILALAASWVREEALKMTKRMESLRLSRMRLDRSGQDVVRKGMLGQRASALRLLNTIANKGAIRGPLRRR